MGFTRTKKGVYVYRSNRGHRLSTQYVRQGEPLNNHAPRVGTKVRHHKCRCDYCTSDVVVNKEKESKKDFEKQKKDLTFLDN